MKTVVRAGSHGSARISNTPYIDLMNHPPHGTQSPDPVIDDLTMEKNPNNVENAKLDADDVDEERAIGGLGGVESEGAGGVRDGDLSAGDGVFAKMQRYVGGLGVEKRGIERVPDTVDERTDTSMSKVGTVVG